MVAKWTRAMRSVGWALLALTVVAAGSARGDVSGGQVICLGRYALCSSAPCQPIENDDSHVLCDCEVPPEGLNIGESTCLERAQGLTSTFSLWDLTATESKPAKRSLACTGEQAGAWAFCLDAPCTARDGRADCTCQIKAPSDYFTLTGECPSSDGERAEICAKTWSAALQAELLSGYSQLWSFYAEIPALEYCPR